MTPVISVVTGFYNSGEYLHAAIQSILGQTFQDFEFLLIDDCSTDDSYMIAAQYAACDSRIKLLRNERNLGLTATLNRGLQTARGRFIARMDDDDVALPERFARQVAVLLENRADIVGANCTSIDQNGAVIGHKKFPEHDNEIKKALPLYNPLCHPAVMIRKEVVDQIGGYNERFRTSQDYEYWFRLAGRGFRFYNVQEVLLLYRESRSEKKRHSFSYRWRELSVRITGYRMIGLPWYRWWALGVPLLLGLLPHWAIQLLKHADPRRNN